VLANPRGPLGWSALAIGLYIVLMLVAMAVIDHDPDEFEVRDTVLKWLPANHQPEVRGEITTATTIEILHRLLHKRGGYLSNDVLPPGRWMDNVPNWEWGVLVQLRDMTKALRNDFSRSQTQSTEDPDLIRADNHLSISNDAWMLPAAEGEYTDAEHALQAYLERLGNKSQGDTQFYARADNLRGWLSLVEKRLGDLSQRLSASVGQVRINTDLAGDAAAQQSTATSDVRFVKTPYTQIDDVFYEARGATWALLHLLRAVEQDFGGVLEKRNAVVSLRQIIRELESTQDPVWSPTILNGEGFGLVANHSLVMASFISRANAAVIDLRMLLERG
jgi:hypothetical protein